MCTRRKNELSNYISAVPFSVTLDAICEKYLNGSLIMGATEIDNDLTNNGEKTGVRVMRMPRQCMLKEDIISVRYRMFGK